MWTGAARELKRPDSGDAESVAGRGLLVAARRRKTSRLREELDQHNGGHHGIVGEMALKVPVPGACDADAARGLAGDQIGDLFDEPHRRSMRKQVHSERA